MVVVRSETSDLVLHEYLTENDSTVLAAGITSLGGTIGKVLLGRWYSDNVGFPS